MENWKERVYASYMSNGFLDAHRMKDEFALQERYFRRNYLKYMPADKTARVLELGCGMGQFLYFCRQNGYTNYVGIDASPQNIEYIKKEVAPDAQVSVCDIASFLASSGGGMISSSLMM